MHKITRITRSGIRIITVAVMAIAVMTATADGFAQSYSGLYHWALEHKLAGWKAESFPLLVDLFILAGELGLFLLALDGHKIIKKKFLSWIDLVIPATVAAIGWSVSLWFNVGHVQNATLDDKVTAGVPPVTAMIGLVILLRTVHRYMARLDEQDQNAVTYDMSRDPVTLKILSQSQADKIDLKAAEDTTAALDVPERETPAALDSTEHTPTGTFAIHDIDPGEAIRVTNRGYAGRHPKWDEGVKLYKESLKGPGKPLSQRDLASALEMSNRSLAAAIIRWVKTHDGHE